MAKKLYRVQASIVFYLLTEEKKADQDAEYYLSEALRDDCALTPDVEEVESPMDIDWDNGSLVYGEHEDDISIEEAYLISTGRGLEEDRNK